VTEDGNQNMKHPVGYPKLGDQIKDTDAKDGTIERNENMTPGIIIADNENV